MASIIRDSPFGQLVRFVTRNRVFLYPDEKPDFQIPEWYNKEASNKVQNTFSRQHHDAPASDLQPPAHDLPADLEKIPTEPFDPEKAESRRSSKLSGSETGPGLHHGINNESGLPQAEDEPSQQMSRTKSLVVVPTRTSDGKILADWYMSDDPENPQNWSSGKKAWTAFVICLYTFFVYASSSVYVSSEELIMQHFGVGNFKAELGLALYVLGYGIGPLIFAPLSEVPQFGRNIPYITTIALFTILAIPTSLVNNLGGLLFLRFLLGFFGSPCLANGGATMGDLYSPMFLPFPLAVWTAFAFAGPAFGPLLSGFAVYAKNWRWSQWEVLWMAGLSFALMFFTLPETQPTTILLHRSSRLRKLTGNERIRSKSEIDRKDETFRKVVIDALIKPIEICIKDPAILFTNIYTAFMYGTYYSFFEAFPLVYPVVYGFNVGETALTFISIAVGCIVAICIYFAYIIFYLVPDINKNGLRAQEHRLVPALFGVFGLPIALFWWAWTTRASIHWIVALFGTMFYAMSAFIIMQAIFIYIAMSYPQYAASLFAGNDFFRSAFAFGAILFSRPMYIDLGTAKGTSLLGGLSVGGIIGMWSLWYYGAKLRARSKFAVSE